MKHHDCIIKTKNIHGNEASGNFVLEEFETTQEAIEHLGEAHILGLINYAHALHEKASIHRQLYLGGE